MRKYVRKTTNQRMKINLINSDGCRTVIDRDIKSIDCIEHHGWMRGQEREPSIRICYHKSNVDKELYYEFNPGYAMVEIIIGK